MSKRRRCDFCGDDLPKDARSNRKFCGEDCRRGRTKPPPEPDPDDTESCEVGEVARAVEESIAKAIQEGRLGQMDRGAIAAARVLARKIDDEALRWEYALEWAHLNPGESGGPKPPAVDNVSIPTFLKFAESLGLTPAGRGRIADGKPGEAGGAGGKLLGLVKGVPKPDAG